jgi:hypothetical protein
VFSLEYCSAVGGFYGAILYLKAGMIQRRKFISKSAGYYNADYYENNFAILKR